MLCIAQAEPSSLSSGTHGGELPVAPSAIAPDGEVFTTRGKARIVAPRALEVHEISGVVAQFKRAAENAKAAGFDGIELHDANGYLLDQFLRDGANRRSDAYSGSIQNRVRFPLEVTDVWGASRVGYEVSPNGTMYSKSDSDPLSTFSYLAKELDRLRIVYLHVAEAIAGPSAVPAHVSRALPLLRRTFKRALIANGGYDLRSSRRAGCQFHGAHDRRLAHWHRPDGRRLAQSRQGEDAP